jgi:hypothetical protein
MYSATALFGGWKDEKFHLIGTRTRDLPACSIVPQPTTLPRALILRYICIFNSRSQRPRGLRHQLSSPSKTLRSWVWIPLEAWMSVCFYSVFVLSCVQVAVLRRSDPPSKESYQLCTGLRNRRGGQGPTKGCRAMPRQTYIQSLYTPIWCYLRFCLVRWLRLSWMIGRPSRSFVIGVFVTSVPVHLKMDGRLGRNMQCQ